jgi:pimeloyl-ACP methyl ester carboxylesterase
MNLGFTYGLRNRRSNVRILSRASLSVKPIAVVSEGVGPEVLLVHGGASPETTWAGLEPLRERWRLSYVYRRGFAPSPPMRDGRADFDLDAADIGPLLRGRPHVVAHSYGALGALIAAGRDPEHVRSLTIIEPPLYLVHDDPDIARLEQMGDAVLTDGLDADPALLREFLRLAGVDVPDFEPLPDAVVSSIRRSHGNRLPGEARPSLDGIRSAAVPVLVVSGGHATGLERICDALAERLDAERLCAPGAGHFVARAPGFRARLDRFLDTAQRA